MIRKFEKAGSGRWTLRGLVLGAFLALVLLPSLAGAQSVADKYQQARARRSLFNLAAGPSLVLQINQFQCGITSDGDICTDVFDSPTGGGGFWPGGTSNQYMFNSGLQVTGIIPETVQFAWAGDTVGAFFFDASGLRKHSESITQIWDSQNAADLANWPAKGSIPDFPFMDAFVDDTSLFASVLIGRPAVSQQDTWTAYWDGNPAFSGGRLHPMGIAVEQRSVAWNYPAGNEASIYFIIRFTNVTNNPKFQSINESKYGIQLPDQGWKLDSMYVAFSADPDVGSDPGNNYATAILPFNMGTTYIGPFEDDGYVYPGNLFHPPFFTHAPGMVGMKYLKSPINPATGEEVGLTSFSLTTVGSGTGNFQDPQTVQQGWRFLSLNVDAGKGDPSCSFNMTEVRARHSCFLSQKESDVRMFVGSGPFSLGPGESATIAVMVYAAATVENPGIVPGVTNPPGVPSVSPGCFGAPIRPIEVGAGYIGPKPGACVEGQPLTQFDVDVVPESLLAKALVAQSVFDNKFLLGFAPEAPPFYLVPGDNKVTVVWEPSKTDKNGDPFFAAAGDPNNPLYDPNYRQFDVEGYRIYRGTSPANLQLVAQFDKAGTVFNDVLCMTDPTHISGSECGSEVAVDIASPFVQYVETLELANGAPIQTKADTALADRIRAGTAFPLTNTDVPYAYIDTDVKNGFQYFYKVTAFDINSVRSGPTSLESAAPSKSTLPRKDVASLKLAGQDSSLTVILVGGTTELNPDAPLPTISAANGTFSGKMPPTNSIEGALVPFVGRLFPDFQVTAQIDSVIASGEGNGDCNGGSNLQGTCWRMYVTMTRGTTKTQSVTYGFSPIRSAWDPVPTKYELGRISVPYDAEAAAQFGIPATATFSAAVTGTFDENIFLSAMEGQKNRRNGGIAGGSRWFSGANETVADPTTFIRVGHLDGVDSIWSPVNHTAQAPGVGQMAGSTPIQCFGYIGTQVARAADFEVTWSGGKPTVKDVTHNVDVPFKPTIQASWGFLNTDANGNGVLDYDDFYYVSNISAHAEWIGFCNHSYDPTESVLLEAAPQLKPVSFSGATTPSGSVGNGFALYINGQLFFFKMNSLPPDNTKWTLRTYSGDAKATTGDGTADPSGYTFTSKPRPPMVPGLKLVFQGKTAVSINEAMISLKDVHAVPDPYYAISQFDLGPATKELQFVGLPSVATIRIYSMSGVLVDIVNHNDPTGGGLAKWDLRNRSNQFVGSGVYFFHVSTPDGKEHVGKFTVVNSGFAR